MKTFNKWKIIPALGVIAIMAWWAYRWNEGLFPTWVDGLGLAVGIVIAWLLFRPARRSSDN